MVRLHSKCIKYNYKSNNIFYNSIILFFNIEFNKIKFVLLIIELIERILIVLLLIQSTILLILPSFLV